MKGFKAEERIAGLPEQIRDRVEKSDPYWCWLPDGWANLVVELDAELRKVVPNYRLSQCKEKFGGLRYYIDYPDECSETDANAAEAIITKYEYRSEETCDVCGKPGNNSTRNGWMATRCEEHE